MTDPLTESERRFLSAREARRTVGLYLLPVALIICCATWIAMWAFTPLLLNPFEAIKRLELQNLEPGTLTTLASLGAVAFNLLFIVLAVCLVFAILWARHERRYLRILHKQQDALQSERAQLAPPKG